MTAATESAHPVDETWESKGLKPGALGLFSSVVIGVASTAPAYSLAATLGLHRRASSVCSHRSSSILAFVPMLFAPSATRS